MKGNDKTTFTKFMSGKGFYVALALCVIGTGTAAWVAVSHTIDSIDQNNSNIIRSQDNDRKDFTSQEEVNKQQSGVGVESSSSAPAPAKGQSSSSQPSNSKGNTGSSAPQSSSVTLEFCLPINGEIITEYSGGKLVKDKTLNEWRTHNGVDIKAPKGTSIVCAAPGKVTGLYDDSMWGTTVEITHSNGLVTIYSGLDKNVLIKKGDTLKNNQQLGVVGQVPCELALDDHIHLAAKKDGKWVDPLVAMGLKSMGEQ